MSGLDWERNADEVLDRLSRFFRKGMRDGILAALPVKFDTEKDWSRFHEKWGKYEESATRPFPSNDLFNCRRLRDMLSG